MVSANPWWQLLRQLVRVGMPSFSILLWYDLDSLLLTSLMMLLCACVCITIVLAYAEIGVNFVHSILQNFQEMWFSCAFNCRMAPTAHWRVAVLLCVILLISHSIHTLIWLMNFVLENQKEASHWMSSKVSVLLVWTILLRVILVVRSVVVNDHKSSCLIIKHSWHLARSNGIKTSRDCIC
jgi:hypothetical protein